MNEMQFSPAYVSQNPSPVQPRNPLKNKLKDTAKKITLLFSEVYQQSSDYVGSTTHSVSSKSKKTFTRMKGYFKKSLLVPGLVLVAVAIVVVYLVGNAFRNTPTTVLSDADQRIDIKKAKAQQTINKQLLFPLKDDKGKEVSKLKYEIQNVQLQDEIVVKGQRATAVKGRTFLIVYIKITNDYDKDISLKTRDYVRLMINGNNEKLAPDIHNDPVEIQAISTKYSRLGFPINDTDKNLILQVGEITGKKENIILNNIK